MKVKISFYCIKEKKSYNVGDKYTGKRKDLGAFLENKQHPKTKKGAISKK